MRESDHQTYQFRFGASKLPTRGQVSGPEGSRSTSKHAETLCPDMSAPSSQVPKYNRVLEEAVAAQRASGRDLELLELNAALWDRAKDRSGYVEG